MRACSAIEQLVYCGQIVGTIALVFFTFGWWTVNPPPGIVEIRKQIAETNGK